MGHSLFGRFRFRFRYKVIHEQSTLIPNMVLRCLDVMVFPWALHWRCLHGDIVQPCIINRARVRGVHSTWSLPLSHYTPVLVCFDVSARPLRYLPTP